MYLGIYINDCYCTAGIYNPDDEVILIEDENSTSDKKYLTPLKIFIEDHYAYIGEPLNSLIANDRNLKYAKCFLDHLEEPNTLIYEDGSNNTWNTPSLIALFLKKIKSDLLVLTDASIQGAIVTTSMPISLPVITSLKAAFEMADIPLYGIDDIGKSALTGYGIKCDEKRTKNIVLYNLDHLSLGIGILQIDEESYSKTRCIEVYNQLGEHVLKARVSEFLTHRYEIISGKKIKENGKNTSKIKQLTDEVMLKYVSENKLYISVVFAVENPMIELIVTRKQLDRMVAKFVHQTLECLKQKLRNTDVQLHDIHEILFTGTSPLLYIIQKYVQKAFTNPELKIHNHNTEQIIVRGVTIHANNAIDREISKSLFIETKKKAVNTSSNTEENESNKHNEKEHSVLIKAMLINSGCEI